MFGEDAELALRKSGLGYYHLGAWGLRDSGFVRQFVWTEILSLSLKHKSPAPYAVNGRTAFAN